MLKVLLLVSSFWMSTYAMSSLEVAKRAYDVVSGYESSVSSTTMVLKNKSGEKNIRKMQIKKLEDINGDKSLITFLYPSDIKGTKLLSFELIAQDDKQWLYLPALKRIKRISARNKSGSFMASEFSYEDISSQNYKNYTYIGDALEVEIDSKNYFQIFRIPKAENSGYSKQILYVEKKTFLIRFGEYYDRQNRIIKKIEFLEYLNIDGIYRIKKIKMTNLQNSKSSMLIWDEDNIKQKLGNREFSKRALK